MHSLRDMAALQEKQQSKVQDSDGLPQNAQRMSRAVAASLQPTLSLLRRLIKTTTSQITVIHCIGQNERIRFFLLDYKPPPVWWLRWHFNTKIQRSPIHESAASQTCQVVIWGVVGRSILLRTSPWYSSLDYLHGSLEEAGKVVEPVQASATERLSLSGGGRLRDLQDPNSRRGRILASMCILRDPVADTRERSSEPFEPSEESITTFAEMGFGRDHALEALETVATNRVEVAMEYALTHPPSSPREDWNINNDRMTLSVNLYNRGKSVQARMAWMTHHPIQMELRISPQTQTHPLPTR